VGESEVVKRVLLQESAMKRVVEPEEVVAMAVYFRGPGASFIRGSWSVMDGEWAAR